MEHFLANVCTTIVELQQDAGRTFAEACASLKLEHSQPRGVDRSGGLSVSRDGGRVRFGGTVEIVAELRARKVPLYALSNWSAETFPIVLKRFEFLHWFQGTVLFW